MQLLINSLCPKNKAVCKLDPTAVRRLKTKQNIKPNIRIKEKKEKLKDEPKGTK